MKFGQKLVEAFHQFLPKLQRYAKFCTQAVMHAEPVLSFICGVCAQHWFRHKQSCVQTVPVPDNKNKSDAVLKGRQERDNVRLPLPFNAQELPTVTMLYFAEFIPRRKTSGRDSRGNADLDCCMHGSLRLVRCIEQPRSVLIVASSN